MSFKDWAVILIASILVLLAVALPFYKLATTDCGDGYYYSVQDYACKPGFRP